MKPTVARRRWLALFLALFALSQGALWLAYYGGGAKALVGDEQGYQARALGILAGGEWMQGTIWPPLQSLWLAALYALFGAHVWIAQLAQSALFIACAGLLRDFWRRFGGSVAAANGAAALFLLNPAIAAYAHWLWPETLHLSLLLAALCLLARQRVFAAGAAVGGAILAKSLLSVFWPAFLLALVPRGNPRQGPRLVAGFVLGLGLVTAPALWHGWREYGKPMIADSSIYNLWIGLTDRWRSDYVEDMGGVTLPEFLASGATPQQRNAIYLDKVRALVEERGGAPLLASQFGRQYFRLFSAKTPLVSQLPGLACAGHLSAYHTPPWLTRGLSVANDALHALILAAAAFGIAAWRRRPDRMFVLVALFAAYQLALFALIHVKARFLLPLLPFLCGFAASFLCASRERGDADAAIARTLPRLAIGAVLAVLLLFLAFAGPWLDGLCAG
ncbi:hypothetical protein [Dokdonella sp.]|uniref:hypothetical protein n=1 Tax=Dokdonella sp. TaxID=2291710 RepID=UPI003783FC9B